MARRRPSPGQRFDETHEKFCHACGVAQPPSRSRCAECGSEEFGAPMPVRGKVPWYARGCIGMPAVVIGLGLVVLAALR